MLRSIQQQSLCLQREAWSQIVVFTKHEHQFRLVEFKEDGTYNYQDIALTEGEARDVAAKTILEPSVTKVLILKEYGEFEVKTVFTKTPTLTTKRGS